MSDSFTHSWAKNRDMLISREQTGPPMQNVPFYASLTAPPAFAVREENQEEAVHLWLLLPGGQGLDAAGRAGDVQTHGGDVRIRKRSQYIGVIMQQGRVKLDKDTQNETDQINQLNTKVQIIRSEANDTEARMARCGYCKLLNEMRK